MKSKDFYVQQKRPTDPENHAQEHVFQSELLNKITATSPLIALMTYVPIVVGLMVFNYSGQFITQGYSVFGVLALGIFTWTLAEYCIHRFLYHEEFKIPILQRGQFLLHGFHHKHPRDKDHLFMPFFGGYIIFFLFWAFFYLLLGAYSFLFMAGFILGYIYYVFLHYYIHRFPPPMKWLEPMWQHHLLHHYKYPDLAYGFSTRLWDWVFRTLPPKEQKIVEKEM